MDAPLDCLVVGAGPAGLTAAIYLARFHLAIRVVDAGTSRAATIPRTRNHAGYPGGIGGTRLLELMREQAAEFGVTVTPGLVTTIARDGDLFQVETEGARWTTRSVLLTTGVVNNRPAIAPDIHDAAVAEGLLRYCPICDGYEVTDKRVGVIGTRTRGHDEALFLRAYSGDITLIAPDAAHALDDEERARLAAAGVRIVDGPCRPLRVEGARMIVPTPEGDLAFDSVYPALGSVIRSELAIALDAEASTDGCLVVDAHQRTSIAGLYAAGDLAKGLDQISHAMGEAGVAATTIRNDLARTMRLAR